MSVVRRRPPSDSNGVARYALAGLLGLLLACLVAGWLEFGHADGGQLNHDDPDMHGDGG